MLVIKHIRMKDKNTQLITALFSKLWQEDQKIKAQNEVILKLISRQQELSLKEIGKDVESVYAQKVLDNKPNLDSLILRALGEN